MNTPLPNDAPFGPETVLSVSTLNRLVRETIESRFPLLWVAGEVSNVTRAASGHVYFTLKDDAAQVRCVMFRSRAQLLAFRLAAGMQVEARGLVSLYEPRGDYQITVETLRRAGAGALHEALARLRAKLEREGLFDDSIKRPLPRFPRRIGIVTSPKAAALRDVLTSLGRRAAHVPIILYPAAVQGDDAPAQLVAALGAASDRAECDVLILARGGGSLEDLWSFNDERLARAIRACAIPVVCGVGHETDVTLADLAADRRAATPTAAAELASEGYWQVRDRLSQLERSLGRDMRRALQAAAQRIDLLERRLVHPRERIARFASSVLHLRSRLAGALREACHAADRRLARAGAQLSAARPDLTAESLRLEALGLRAGRAARLSLQARAARVDTLAAHLSHLDPRAPLRRGYAIVRTAGGDLVRSCAQLSAGDAVHAQFGEGAAELEVKRTRPLASR